MTYDDLYNGTGDNGLWNLFMDTARELGTKHGSPDPQTSNRPARLPAPEDALRELLAAYNVEPAVEGDYSPEVQVAALTAYCHGYSAALAELPF